MCVCEFMMSMFSAHRGQKGALNLGIGVIGHLTWVPGTEPVYSGRTVSALNHCAISPAPF